MKLNIDIPDTLYRIIQEDDIKTASHTVWVMFMIEAIKNGVPHVNTDRTAQDFADKYREYSSQYIRKSVLEDIKAEIDEMPYELFVMKKEVLDIIDRHTKGVSK